MNPKIDAPTTPVARVPAVATPASPPATAERGAAAPAAPPADDVRLTGEAAALRDLQSNAKAGPTPLDQAKVDAVRAQLAAGTYRINPAEVARRLDALERTLGK